MQSQRHYNKENNSKTHTDTPHIYIDVITHSHTHTDILYIYIDIITHTHKHTHTQVQGEGRSSKFTQLITADRENAESPPAHLYRASPSIFIAPPLTPARTDHPTSTHTHTHTHTHLSGTILSHY